jgi:alkane 1-monooxygenase
MAFYATAQLLMSDYVQHYGLRRRVLPGGRLEPVGPQHSWNAPQWFTSRLMLNAPRHSEHHAHPARPYPALALPGPDEAPTLPRSLPVMGMIALIPSRWRGMMDPKVEDWTLRRITAE